MFVLMLDVSVTSETLLALIASGDQGAFAQLYDRWAGRVNALIIQVLRDASLSEEVLQEVFLEVWQRASSFDPEAGSASAWLATIAKRRAVDRVRSAEAARRRESHQRNIYPDFDSTIEQATAAIQSEELHHALNRVGEPHRSTLIYAYFSGMSHSEISEHLCVPLGTVKGRIRDGVAKLRAQLEVDR